MASRAISERIIHPRPAWPRRAGRAASLRREIERTALAPLPASAGLAETLSPVDLPAPAVPLPHPLRWTSEAIAVATLFLALFNAPAIRSWAYQLPPNDETARVVTAAEAWYDLVGRAGLNRPVEAMHAWWQSGRDARFGSPSTAGPDRVEPRLRPGGADPLDQRQAA
ncbi:MAG TPA: hypothetical protein VH331_05615 [Allosphingosinicella sp.]|jgi:hypothetical protein|nr:hypothetical protein [Allosphingosinicella sp.]